MDVKVDSNNDGKIDPETDGPHKDDSSKTGKLIQVNDVDANSNNIPDYADWSAGSGTNLVPMTLAVPSNLPDSATVSFDYSASSPDDMPARTGSGTNDDPYVYKPASGDLRIWTTDGSGGRDEDDVADDGDFVNSDTPYTLSDLGLSGGKITLYVEAVHSEPAGTVGQEEITVNVDAFSGEASDAVRLTSYPGLIRTDANRDNTVNFTPADSSESDRTSENRPYSFWLNDNVDQPGNEDDGSDAEELNPSPSFDNELDLQSGGITDARDLEDYSRFRILTPPGYDPSSWSVKILMSPTDGVPGIEMYDVAHTVSDTYLTNALLAGQLIGKSFDVRLKGSSDAAIPSSDFSAVPNVSGGQLEANFLFDAVSAGSGTVKIEFDKNGKSVATDSFDLQLQTAKQMYETYPVGNGTYSYGVDRGANSSPNLFGYNWPDPTSSNQAAAAYSTYREIGTSPYTADSPQTNNYIVFVHGWRMLPWEKDYYANTAFKRLFWQGYKGKFAAFDWPTEWINENKFQAVIGAITQNFSESELRAWYSAPALLNLLLDLRSHNQVNVISHSMGAIVTSEALREYAVGNQRGAPIVNTYIASQGATWAEAYDGAGAGTDGLDEYTSLQTAIGHSYFAHLGYAASHLANFYNPVDYALIYEKKGNDAVKGEDQLHNIDGYYQADGNFFGPNNVVLNTLPDRFAILSMISKEGSYPLGRSVNVGGPFDNTLQVDLQATFGFTDADTDHSAQFESNEAVRGKYWKQVLKTMGLS